MVTMKDIAQKAGVSMMTVSRVINSPDMVSEKTRLKVQQIMDDFHFHPNITAKALVTNQTRTIHIFLRSVVSTRDPFLMALLAGISDCLSASYYSFLIRREREFPYKSDGVIAIGTTDEDIKSLQAEINEPIVLFGKTHLDIDWVDLDHYKGSYMMTKHIIEKGHKKIGFIAVKTKELFASERLNGYKKAMEEAGLEVLPQSVKYVVNHTERSGFEQAKQLLEEVTEMTAIVCSSDVLALGAITAAKSLGLHVPNDLSIGGFDGIFLDQTADPPLTTILQPVHAIGQELARQLVARIAEPDRPKVQHLIEPTLIERESVKEMGIGTRPS